MVRARRRERGSQGALERGKGSPQDGPHCVCTCPGQSPSSPGYVRGRQPGWNTPCPGAPARGDQLHWLQRTSGQGESGKEGGERDQMKKEKEMAPNAKGRLGQQDKSEIYIRAQDTLCRANGEISFQRTPKENTGYQEFHRSPQGRRRHEGRQGSVAVVRKPPRWAQTTPCPRAWGPSGAAVPTVALSSTVFSPMRPSRTSFRNT